MTITTTERLPAPVQQQAGSLAIRPDQTNWTTQQQAVLQQSGINDDVTAAELSAFLHLCQRTKLDPFSRQIYLIGRWDNRAGRKVYTPQTSIDGYRVIAHRAAAEAGHALGYEDTLWCDAAGRWRDVWLDEQPPAAAKVTVIRNGQRFSAVARFAEYVQTGKGDKVIGLWGKMPAGQTAKCCEALALRKAFPHDLAGVYTAEEMAQADNPEPAASFQRQAPAQDQWEQATPAPSVVQQPAGPAFDAAAEGDISGGRDWINEATEAKTADNTVQVWHAAKAGGAHPAVLNEIVAIGKEKRAAEQQADAGADPATGDGNEHPTYTGPADGSQPETLPGAPVNRLDAIAAMYAAGKAAGLSQVEVRQVLVDQAGRGIADATPEDLAAVTADFRDRATSPQGNAVQAEGRLRAAATQAHLTTVDADFYAIYGLPIDQGTAQQLDQFRARIEAAGGQQ